MNNSEKKYRIPAVEKLLALIEFLSNESEPFTISALAKHLAASKNMVFRIVKCLEEQGYLELDRDTGGYQLGNGFYCIGVKMADRYQLTQRARPHLVWLSQQTGEMTDIQVPSGDRMIVIDAVYPPSGYYFHVSVGAKLFYHCNAMGKCILAHLEKEKINAIIPAQLPMLTPNGLSTRAELLKQLKTVQETGLGYDREEYVSGIYCIATPVFDIRGDVVAGVGVSGLVSRIDNENRHEFEELVREAGRRISTAVGYRKMETK